MEDNKSNYIINNDDSSTVNDDFKEIYMISFSEETNNTNNYEKKEGTNETDKKSYDAGKKGRKSC